MGQVLAPPAPQAAGSQAALLQATLEASMPSHNPVAAEVSTCDRSQEKVVLGAGVTSAAGGDSRVLLAEGSDSHEASPVK